MVLKAAKEAVSETRKFKPCLIEACTYRLREHWGPGEDWHLGYRTREEGDEWLAKCPFKQLRKVFDKSGNLSQLDIDDMEEMIKKEIDAAVKFALESPAPPENELLSEVGG